MNFDLVNEFAILEMNLPYTPGIHGCPSRVLVGRGCKNDKMTKMKMTKRQKMTKKDKK